MYSQAYPDLTETDPVAVQQALAQRPVPGVNVHPEAEGPRSPAWIQEQTIEPLAFGSLADPVSQMAFMAAPGLLRGLKTGLEVAGSPGPSRLGAFASERGNLGPVPRSQAGEALPQSAVRDEAGKLKRLYHGTGRGYADFEMAQAGSGAGGNLYGPGIYMTDSPAIASSYAKTGSNMTRQYVVENRNWDDLYNLLEKQGVLDDQGVLVTKAGTRDPATGRELYSAYRLQEHGANVRPVYADLKRPFDMERMYTPDELYQVAQISSREGMRGHELYDFLAQSLHGKDQANAALRQAGYDGITHIGGGVTGSEPHRVYIAFSPEHVYPSVNVESPPLPGEGVSP
jgi:hypothetical protein